MVAAIRSTTAKPHSHQEFMVGVNPNPSGVLTQVGIPAQAGIPAGGRRRNLLFGLGQTLASGHDVLVGLGGVGPVRAGLYFLAGL